MINALTVDVEDYFQVNAFAQCIRPDDWHHYPRRVAANTGRVLDLLEQRGIRGTFFVLGWVAEREPELVREICSRGHEIACHGYGHQLIYQIGPKRFREDVRHAKAILEQLTGEPVRGYRAPSYSITHRSLWALEVLVEEGFSYDSSIFPVYHDVYGIPGAPRFPHQINTPAGPLAEFPITTYRIGIPGRECHLPVAGGGYLRLLPAPLIGQAFSSINRVERRPAVLYFHPWEIDPDQPRIKAQLKSVLRHYLNLRYMTGKLAYLLDRFRFSTMREVLLNQGVQC